jgi:hypothetical protein
LLKALKTPIYLQVERLLQILQKDKNLEQPKSIRTSAFRKWQTGSSFAPSFLETPSQ